jgi:diacylglycerol kinase family enzyme
MKRHPSEEAILVVNTHEPPRGTRRSSRLARSFGAAGIELIDRDRHAVKRPERDAAGEGDRPAPMVIVGGGDGSLSSTIDDFLGSDTVFAILPLGTANSFAKTLGVPLDLDGAST